jgi:methionyl-tRNA formyltransferase
MMRVMILTQDESLYLPASLAVVCRELGERIVAIVTAPAMSTHGGSVRGLLKHMRVFGMRGTWQMATRVITAKLRDRLCSPTPDGPFFSVKAVADAFEIPYCHVDKMKSGEFEEVLKCHVADLLISISCPQIIGREVRNHFPRGCINVHGAPLPKYRGLMPAFWALKNGEKETASTVHDLAAKLDDGDIILQRVVAIEADETWDSLVRKTKAAGAKALVDAVLQIEDGTVRRRPNPEEESTYFSFPTPKDGREFRRSGKFFF